MKLLLLTMLPIFSFSQVRSGIDHEITSYPPTHYGAHFLGGFIVSGTVASLNSLTPTQSLYIGATIGLIAGFNKELADYSRGNLFSTGDLFYTAAGGLLSSMIIYHVKNHYWKNKGRKDKIFMW